MNFRYRFMQFMSGRYGSDETFFVLVVIASVLAMVNVVLRSAILQLIVYALTALALWRSLSRNLEARRAENRRVKTAVLKIKRSMEERKRRSFDTTHVYKKCPACKAVLRLPKKKGKHTTVCPKCSHKFKVRVFKE